MSQDPRTPVLVGVGQVTVRPDPSIPLALRPEPVELMARALEAAASDAGTAGPRLLREAGSLRVVSSLGWRLPNPGLLVAARLGIEPAEQVLTAVGGNMPVSLLLQSARSIASGEADVVLVTGAECVYTRTAARREGVALRWSTQAGADAPSAFGQDTSPVTDLEAARGILLPIHAYPLLENALRGGAGLDEQRRRIGELWSRFSRVAASNPHAWLPEERTPAEITGVSPSNRMVALPYTKLCTANMQVDQGAAYVCCSVSAARAAGVPEERWVFPLAGADAHDHWYLSERPDLHRSPAIRLAGERALALAGLGVDDLEAVDLYSCFPCVVQIAAAELGLSLHDDRPLTTTGGLTFAGGPGNNYATHGIAALVDRLRRSPGSAGVTTGLGWYATKHAVAVLASRPPVDGFCWEDVQREVDALPRCPVDAGATGPVTVETYTVTYDREGSPERGIVACRTPGGARAWANAADPEELATGDPIGRTGRLDGAGTLHL